MNKICKTVDKIKVLDKTYYSIGRACLEYGCTRKTIYDWIKKQQMEVKLLGHVKFVRKTV